MAEEAPVGRTVLVGRLSAKSVIWRASFRLPLMAKSSPSPLRQTNHLNGRFALKTVRQPARATRLVPSFDCGQSIGC